MNASSLRVASAAAYSGILIGSSSSVMHNCDSIGIEMPEIKTCGKESQIIRTEPTTTHLNNRCEEYSSKEDKIPAEPAGLRSRRLSYNLSEVKTMQKKMRRLSVPSRDGCYYAINRKHSVENYRSFTKQTNSSLTTK